MIILEIIIFLNSFFRFRNFDPYITYHNGFKIKTNNCVPHFKLMFLFKLCKHIKSSAMSYRIASVLLSLKVGIDSKKTMSLNTMHF